MKSSPIRVIPSFEGFGFEVTADQTAAPGEYTFEQHHATGHCDSVVVLILNAVLKLLKKGVVDKPTAVIAALVFLGAVLTDLSPAVFVVCSGIAGILLKNVGGKEAKA